MAIATCQAFTTTPMRVELDTSTPLRPISQYLLVVLIEYGEGRLIVTVQEGDVQHMQLFQPNVERLQSRAAGRRVSLQSVGARGRRACQAVGNQHLGMINLSGRRRRYHLFMVGKNACPSNWHSKSPCILP